MEHANRNTVILSDARGARISRHTPAGCQLAVRSRLSWPETRSVCNALIAMGDPDGYGPSGLGLEYQGLDERFEALSFAFRQFRVALKFNEPGRVLADQDGPQNGLVGAVDLYVVCCKFADR